VDVRRATAWLGRDLAVDLGTANTLVYMRGRGVVLSEPSVMAVDTRTGSVLAVGEGAKQMLGRTPAAIAAIRPLHDGVIADFDAAEDMLRAFIQRVHPHGFWSRPRLVVAVPTGVTGVQLRAVEEAGYAAGARRVYIVEEPMAAAIGAGLPVYEAAGSMIVDVGGGTTDVAVLSLGGVVSAHSIPIGGEEMDDAIVQHVKKEYSLLLGERTAESIKIALGSAFPLEDEPDAEIRGRDMVTGLPSTILVSAAEIRRALDEPVTAIIDAVHTVLDATPPELAGDIADAGIVLAGGGAQLGGLADRMRHDLQMPVRVAEQPDHCVAMGAGRCVENLEALRSVVLTRPGRPG
jgi:rod shape-determining protein MreB